MRNSRFINPSMRCFNSEAASGGSSESTETNEQPTDKGGNNKPGVGDKGSGGDKADNATGEDEEPKGRMFTQADVDRIVQGRLAKFSDYEQIKADLAKASTDHEAALTQAVETAKAEAAGEERAKLTPLIIDAEIRAATATLGFKDPSDAAAFIKDRGGFTNDDGEINTASIAKAVKDLAGSKPYLLGAPDANTVGLGGSSNPGNHTLRGVDRIAAAVSK